MRSCSSCFCIFFRCFRLVSHTSTKHRAFRPLKSKLVTLWTVSKSSPIQLHGTDSCDRWLGGISSEGFPS